MKGTVNTYISKRLYNILCNEREKLRIKEKKKRGKKKKITMIDACNSISRKLLR